MNIRGFWSMLKKIFGSNSYDEYVSSDLYETEEEMIDAKIKEINKIIKFYEAKRKILEEWRSVVRIGIKKSNEEECCKNCMFFSLERDGFCRKFSSCVEKDANCVDFKWNV